LPSRSLTGTFTSVRKTSLNSEPPSIWRIGDVDARALHVDEEERTARPTSAPRDFVRTRIQYQSEMCASVVQILLAVHDVEVALALGARLRRGHVGARRRLGVARRPDLFRG